MVYIGIKAREKFNDKHKFAMVNRIFEEVLEEFYLSSLLFAPTEGIISIFDTKPCDAVEGFLFFFR